MGQTYLGNLVHLTVDEKITNEQILAAKLTPAEMTATARNKMVLGLAEFLTKHFCTVTGGLDGVQISAKLTLMMPSVPKGLAHTPIIFQEREPCPTSPAPSPNADRAMESSTSTQN